MDLSQLQLFKDIVHARSISRGAAQNGITQSAASQTVQELERVLGLRLLDRSRRPLDVLPAGRLLNDFARDVLRRRQEFLTQLDGLKGDEGGLVRVAAIYSVGLVAMTHLEEQFYRRLPAAQLVVDYLRPEKVYQAVLEERADLGLLSYPVATHDISVLPWRDEPMVVACGRQHILAGRQRVHVAELEACEFIAFDEDLPISREIDHFLRERGVHVRTVMHFDNIQSMKEALRLGTALSILPAPMLADEVAEGRLKIVPLDAPLFRPLGIIQRRRKTLPRAAQIFLELLRDPSA